MSTIWNNKTIKRPVIRGIQCKSTDINLKNVTTLLQNGIDTFIIPDALKLDYNIMCRLIYRNKLSFRHDKGFKFFENTNRKLKKLLSFTIIGDLIYFLNGFPKSYEKDILLPSKQMLEYILVRLQGYAQLSCQVVEAAYNTAKLMNCRLTLGHQWNKALVFLAIVSRIWQICKYLTTKCCLLYDELLPLLDKLQTTDTKWLPDGYEFPKDLVDWLDYDWLLDKPEVIFELPLELPIFSLLDDEDDEIRLVDMNNANNSIIILDSDEEDDEVQFVRNYNNKRQVKKCLSSRRNTNKMIINIDDSDSDDNTNETNINNEDIYISETENNFSDKNDDVSIEIIESPKLQHEQNNTTEISAEPMNIDDEIGELVSRELINSDNLPPFASIYSNLYSQDNNMVLNCEEDKKMEQVLTTENENTDLIVNKPCVISTIHTIEDLELFLTKENQLRQEKNPESIFSKLNNNEWQSVTQKIETIIDNARNKPIKNIVFVRRARKLLRKHLFLNKSGAYSSDSDSDSISSYLRSRAEKLGSNTSKNKLFDFIKTTESFELRTLSTKALRKKLAEEKLAAQKNNKNLKNSKKGKQNSVNNKNTPPKNQKEQTPKKSKSKNRKKRNKNNTFPENYYLNNNYNYF